MLGIRADEQRRLAKIGNQDYGKHEEKDAPLGRAGVTKEIVGEFWKNQPFDLELPNINGVTYHGNCDLCYLKGGSQILSLIAEKPELGLGLGALAVMVMVFTLEAAIHVIHYYKASLGEADPLGAALKLCWKPCLVSMLTTTGREWIE